MIVRLNGEVVAYQVPRYKVLFGGRCLMFVVFAMLVELNVWSLIFLQYQFWHAFFMELARNSIQIYDGLESVERWRNLNGFKKTPNSKRYVHKTILYINRN